MLALVGDWVVDRTVNGLLGVHHVDMLDVDVDGIDGLVNSAEC